ncbi:MAG: subclass B1 metallo-beta-lactamase [Vicinamibacteria bacterium]
MFRLAATASFCLLVLSSAGPTHAGHSVTLAIAPGLVADAPQTRLGDDLVVRPLRDGFWLHASASADGIDASGLLAPLRGGGVLLVDTPWTDAQTERLLDWAAERLGGVRDAIVTHSHADRMGGIAALRKRGVRALALDLTAAKAAAEGLPIPDVLLRAAERVKLDPRGFEAFYPGAGHTVDNLVVAFPEAGIVHGGCLLKSEDAQDQGYVAESMLGDWPAAVEAVAERYPKADVVVPGHGTVGGRAAFSRTLEIVRAARAAEAPRKGGVHEAVPAAPDAKARWLFYLHGAIVEREGRKAVSPDFGPYEYDAILAALAARGFEVVSQVRTPGSGTAFVSRLVDEVGRLREAGVPAERIALAGASRGGALALEAAARLSHPGLSVVVISGCGPQTLANAPKLRGRVLSIRDEPDRFDPTCAPLFAAAAALSASREDVLHLGLDHGLLFRPRAEWLDPLERWTKGASGLRP